MTNPGTPDDKYCKGTSNVTLRFVADVLVVDVDGTE